MAQLCACEQLQNPFERADYRSSADRLAAAAEAARLAVRRLALADPREADHSDRLVGAATTRARNSRDGKRDRSPAALERAGRHFARCFLAHRAMFPESFL